MEKQLHFLLLKARDDNRGREAVKTLYESGFSDVVFHQLDLMDPSSIGSLANFINTQFHKLDILVNNAGVSGIIADAEAFTSLLNLSNNEVNFSLKSWSPNSQTKTICKSFG
ncbi:hypothetical protein EZV62_010488 [Acer yangbiense]|uniref:Uncharacterized protein n=1 Tax=Acer yangbiense TaxID=1000413 RepID=A0A5C7I332_9ROSI|nr:hypothetical protein EZV62_010488 [Acer yangbiense]